MRIGLYKGAKGYVGILICASVAVSWMGKRWRVYCGLWNLCCRYKTRSVWKGWTDIHVVIISSKQVFPRCIHASLAGELLWLVMWEILAVYVAFEISLQEYTCLRMFDWCSVSPYLPPSKCFRGSLFSLAGEVLRFVQWEILTLYVVI